MISGFNSIAIQGNFSRCLRILLTYWAITHPCHAGQNNVQIDGMDNCPTNSKQTTEKRVDQKCSNAHAVWEILLDKCNGCRQIQLITWKSNKSHESAWDAKRWKITWSWASCQIRKIAGAHAPGLPGTFSPSPQVSDPDMHHGTCVTHVPWCMPGSLTSGLLWNRRRGKTFPAFLAHAQPAILRIW